MASGIEQQLIGDFLADMRDRCQIIRTQMEFLTQQDAPHVSGDLRRAIRMEPFQESGGIFSATIAVDPQEAPQGVWTNEGTGEYIGAGRIYPTRARALSFFWLKIGKHVVLASVAGQPGQHWWDGPSGGAEDARLDDALRVAFGS